MKKLIAATLLAGSSALVSAEPVVGIGYTSFDADIVTVGALVFTAGYEFGGDTGWGITPEVSIGTGVKDDTFSGVTIEIDRWAAFALRAEYAFESGAYLFAKPSYGNLKIEGSAFGNSASSSDSEFGYGAGVGGHFGENSALELFFQKFDDTDIIGAAYRYTF